MDIIFSFAALMVISTIDQIYLESIQNNLKEELYSESVNFTIQVADSVRSSIYTSKRHTMFSWFISILNFVYEFIYFHFVPYIAIMLLNWRSLTEISRDTEWIF